MVKTRKKQIDTRALLGLSSNHRNILKSPKQDGSLFKAKSRISKDTIKHTKNVSNNVINTSTSSRNDGETINSPPIDKENDVPAMDSSKTKTSSLLTPSRRMNLRNMNANDDAFKKPDAVVTRPNKVRYSFEAPLSLRPSATSTPARARSDTQTRSKRASQEPAPVEQTPPPKENPEPKRLSTRARKPTTKGLALTEQKKKKPAKAKLSKTQPAVEENTGSSEDIETVYLSDDSDATGEIPSPHTNLPRKPLNRTENRKFFTSHRALVQPVTLKKGVLKVEVPSRKIIKRSQSVARDRLIVEPFLTHRSPPTKRRAVTERKKKMEPNKTVAPKLPAKRTVKKAATVQKPTDNQQRTEQGAPTLSKKQSLQRRLILDDNDNADANKSEDSTEDVYEFLPSQASEKPDQLDNSYIQGLIDRFKQEKKQGKKRQVKGGVSAKKKEVIKANLQTIQNLVKKIDNPVQLNKAEQAMEKIRKRLSAHKGDKALDENPINISAESPVQQAPRVTANNPTKLNKTEQAMAKIRQRLSLNKSMEGVEENLTPMVVPTMTETVVDVPMDSPTKTEAVAPVKMNKTEQAMEKIRQRLAAKKSLEKGNETLNPTDNITPYPKTPTTVVPNRNRTVSENSIPPYQSPVHGQDSSYLPSPPNFSFNSPTTSRRVITNPVPSTSKAGNFDLKSNVTQRRIINPVPSTSKATPTQLKTPTLFKRVSDPNRTPNRNNLGAVSPWRIDDEQMHVPRTKYFALSHDLLPSFSSDMIVQNNLPIVRSPEGRESAELNNSDGENVAPPNVKPAIKVKKPAKRTPFQIIELEPTEATVPEEKNTPARASPLTTENRPDNRPRIQVLSNVTVNSPYQVVNNRLVRTTEPSNETPFEQNAENIQEDQPNDPKTADVSNYFGFDESSDEEPTPVKPIRPTDLHRKLKSLRKMAINNCAMNTTDREAETPMPDLFRSPAKERDTLRRMLDKPKPPPLRAKPIQTFDSDSDSSSDFETYKRPSKDDQTNDRESVQTNADGTEPSVRLFAEPDELSFRREPEYKRRSYMKPHRMRNNKRLYNTDNETDSDSGSDDEDENGKKKRKKRPAKRQKPDVENTEEFKQFVEEFNSLCEEVDQFELVVEKEKDPNKVHV